MSTHLRPSVFRFMCLAFGMLLAMTWDSSPLNAQNTFPVANLRWRLTPPVIWCGDRFMVEIQIVGRNDVASVRLVNFGDWETLDERTPISRHVLLDDGQNGDRAPGDNVFTLTDIKPSCDSKQLIYAQSAGQWLLEIDRVILKSGATQFLDGSRTISVAVVDSRYKNVFQVRDLGNGLSATAFAFFISDAKRQVYNDYTQATDEWLNWEAWRKLYGVLPDAFDVGLLMRGESLIVPVNTGVSSGGSVSNQVKYIGLPPQDDTASHGSKGRLKSRIRLGFSLIEQFAHELGHTWGAYIGSSLGLTDGTGHWNRQNNNLGGQIGSCSFYVTTPRVTDRYLYESNGDGTFRGVPCKGVYGQYSPLELYLMGLIPPEQVPPIHFLTEPDHSNISRITAKSIRTVTIQDIIRAEGGVRSPSASQSQKEFTVAFMVTQDRAYSDASYAYFSLLSYLLMSRNPPAPGKYSIAPFYWATGGRATVNTRLPVNLPEPLGLPPLVGALAPAPTPTHTTIPTPTRTPTSTPTTIPTPTRTPATTPTSPPTQVAVVAPTAFTPVSPPAPASQRQPLIECNLPVGGVVLAGLIVFRWRRKPCGRG